MVAFERWECPCQTHQLIARDPLGVSSPLAGLEPDAAVQYAEGIRRAADAGLITWYAGKSRMPAQELYAHYTNDNNPELSLKPTKTRPLCRHADAILRSLQTHCPQILELGPGAGTAAVRIKRLVPSCTLKTISLTPINPFPLSAGSEDAIGTAPVIDHQYIGDVAVVVPKIEGRFDFIYDNFGPVFWQLIEASRAGNHVYAKLFIQSILDLLKHDGVLYVGASDDCHWLERMLENEARSGGHLIRLPTLFKHAEIRPNTNGFIN